MKSVPASSINHEKQLGDAINTSLSFLLLLIYKLIVRIDRRKERPIYFARENLFNHWIIRRARRDGKGSGRSHCGEINFACVIREDKVNLFFVLSCSCVYVYIYIFFRRSFNWIERSISHRDDYDRVSDGAARDQEICHVFWQKCIHSPV